MITDEYFDQLSEQIRLSYAHLLKMHLRFWNRFHHFKNEIKDVNLKKDFFPQELFFYDESGIINWKNVLPLLPPGIEKKIKNEYNMLNQTEVRLCCLILLNVPGKDILKILPFTHKSIHTVTYRIKQKLGMKNIQKGIKPLLVCATIE